MESARMRREMRGNILEVAARIVMRVDRGHPADQVLRQELKALGAVSAKQGGEISRAVFSYFRWVGWVGADSTVVERLRRALKLAERFQQAPGGFEDAELVRRAVPAWVEQEMEVSAAWARSLQSEPRLWLRARVGRGGILVQTLNAGAMRARAQVPACGFGEGRLADIVEYHGTQDLFRTPAFHGGEFEIQDISSQAVGLICDPGPGETWWDACAGEGGKLLHLSDLMGNKGLIWGSDRSERRLRKLKARAARAKVFNYRLTPWDGGEQLPTRVAFDGVLMDAPCSGLGTWGRNPHARWTTTPQDVRELAEVQKRLLLQAARAVKGGGKLVYAVCTLTHSETHGVLEALEASCPELEPLRIRSPLEPWSAPAHGLVIRSERHGGNGMFVAAWRKKLSEHSTASLRD